MTSIGHGQTVEDLLLFRIERHENRQQDQRGNDRASRLIIFLKTSERKETFIIMEKCFQIIVMYMLSNTKLDKLLQQVLFIISSFHHYRS